MDLLCLGAANLALAEARRRVDVKEVVSDMVDRVCDASYCELISTLRSHLTVALRRTRELEVERDSLLAELELEHGAREAWSRDSAAVRSRLVALRQKVSALDLARKRAAAAATKMAAATSASLLPRDASIMGISDASLLHVFSFLDAGDVVSVAQASKGFHARAERLFADDEEEEDDDDDAKEGLEKKAVASSSVHAEGRAVTPSFPNTPAAVIPESPLSAAEAAAAAAAAAAAGAAAAGAQVAAVTSTSTIKGGAAAAGGGGAAGGGVSRFRESVAELFSSLSPSAPRASDATALGQLSLSLSLSRSNTASTSLEGGSGGRNGSSGGRDGTDSGSSFKVKPLGESGGATGNSGIVDGVESSSSLDDLSASLSPPQLRRIIALHRRCHALEEEAAGRKEQFEDLKEKFRIKESVRVFLLDKLRSVENKLKAREEELAMAKEQNASDREVLAFLDARQEEAASQRDMYRLRAEDAESRAALWERRARLAEDLARGGGGFGLGVVQPQAQAQARARPQASGSSGKEDEEDEEGRGSGGGGGGGEGEGEGRGGEEKGRRREDALATA